jgi:peptidyl-prolyl cis-trans isomerase C
MKSVLVMFVLVLIALPLVAQKTAAPSDGEKVVATVNGEVITKAKLDQLWNGMASRIRMQYERSGRGKAGFLDNYVRKQLLIQEATASGFATRPETQAELEAQRESALFDLYVRNVIAAPLVTDAAIRKFYDEHTADLTMPATVHLYQIFIGLKDHSHAAAMEKASGIMGQLFKARATVLASGGTMDQVREQFRAAAQKSSEDDDTASAGGDLGWVDASRLDPKVAETAFGMKPGSISGIVETEKGLYVLFVDGQRPASTDSLETARDGIREYLLATHANEVNKKVEERTTKLWKSGKVAVFPENLQ